MNIGMQGTGWWLNHSTPKHRTTVVTVGTIAIIRAWAEAALGVPATLVIERSEERNRVALCFHGIGEAEVASLIALHRRRLRGAQLEQTLREACCESTRDQRNG